MEKQPEPRYEVEKRRADIGWLLDSHYPEFSGLHESIEDAHLLSFEHLLTESPSGSFLRFCASSVDHYSMYRASVRVDNMLIAVQDVFAALGNGEQSQRMRSAVVSLTVEVVKGMERMAWGGMLDQGFNQQTRTWVTASVLLAYHLPELWHQMTDNETMLLYMATIAVESPHALVEYCLEHRSLNHELIEEYSNNNSPPLRGGVL